MLRYTTATLAITIAAISFAAPPPLPASPKKPVNVGSTGYDDLQMRSGVIFAMKSQPPKKQPFLVALKSVDDAKSERVVLDPNTLDPTGATAIDFYAPSLDGKFVAASLSKNGTKDGTLHVYDTATGKALPDVIPGVNYPTAGGSVTWRGDNAGFFYTRYPRGEEKAPEDRHFYQEVYFHRLGNPVAADAYVLGGDFPRIAETALQTSDDGRYVLASVSNGDGGEYAHHVLGPSGWWTQVTAFPDKISTATIGPDDALYLLSHKDDPRGKVLRLSLGDPRPELANATIVIEQSDATIVEVIPTKKHIFILDVLGGPSRIRVCDATGKKCTVVPTPRVFTVGGAFRSGDTLIFSAQSFTQPSAWFRYDPATGKMKRTALLRSSPARFDDTIAVRTFATSKDGAKIPMSVVIRKASGLDSNP